MKKQGFARDHEGKEVRQKLIELINRFDRVKLIWSCSIAQSCHFFQQLKENRPEPDVLKF